MRGPGGGDGEELIGGLDDAVGAEPVAVQHTGHHVIGLAGLIPEEGDEKALALEGVDHVDDARIAAVVVQSALVPRLESVRLGVVARLGVGVLLIRLLIGLVGLIDRLLVIVPGFVDTPVALRASEIKDVGSVLVLLGGRLAGVAFRQLLVRLFLFHPRVSQHRQKGRVVVYGLLLRLLAVCLHALLGPLLIAGDFARHRAIFACPDAIEHAPAEIQRQHRHQPKHKFGGMDGDAKGPENVREGQRLAPVDAPDNLRFLRH